MALCVGVFTLALFILLDPKKLLLSNKLGCSAIYKAIMYEQRSKGEPNIKVWSVKTSYWLSTALKIWGWTHRSMPFIYKAPKPGAIFY